MRHGTETWQAFLADGRKLIGATPPYQLAGRLTRINGLVMEASGLKLPLGSGCRINIPGGASVEAEVVGFHGEKIFLMPTDDVFGLAPGAQVLPVEPTQPPLVAGERIEPRRRASDRAKHLPMGDELLGRVVDGAGRPLDGLGPLTVRHTRSLQSRPINPLQRAPIRQSLDVGIRAINGLLTVGRGQRMGLFAGSGVGKSVLIGMMARYTAADVIVVGLIGERGREVKEFIEHNLGAEGLARSAVIAAPADCSPLMRLQGASYATAVAEYFRDQGRQVLLIMDSLTRYALALREVALAAGEPPAARGFPPSVFARLPALVERAGNGRDGGGSVTAFYTILMEGDDQQDPVADNTRAILDGHIVLGRRLAEQGHFPAIDLRASISRVMPALADAEQLRRVYRLKELESRYAAQQDLIAVGAYTPGSDPVLDQAVQAHAAISQFLRQGMREAVDLATSRVLLAQLMAPYLPAAAAA